MKVVLINGSPRKNGNTNASLAVVGSFLQSNGVEIEYIHIGNQMVRGCSNCGKCEATSRCIFDDDPCNKIIEAIIRADGVIIGSPVYFAAPNGALCALLDRVFYAASEHGQLFAGKPAAALVSCYRSGGTAALDRLNKYFTFSQMPVVSSLYWNMVFEPGGTIEEDLFGNQILQTLAENMLNILSKKALI